MLKLEALDRDTVRKIEIFGDVVHVEASINWPEMLSIDGPGQPAIAIIIKTQVLIGDDASPEAAVDLACKNAVEKLNAAFDARFPEVKLKRMQEELFLQRARAM